MPIKLVFCEYFDDGTIDLAWIYILREMIAGCYTKSKYNLALKLNYIWVVW